MTREELIKEIAKRVKDIKELYYREYPEGDYLILYFRKNSVSFNNSHWERPDEDFPIDYSETEEYIMLNGEYEAK